MTSDGWTTGMPGAQGGRPPGRGGGWPTACAFVRLRRARAYWCQRANGKKHLLGDCQNSDGRTVLLCSLLTLRLNFEIYGQFIPGSYPVPRKGVTSRW